MMLSNYNGILAIRSLCMTGIFRGVSSKAGAEIVVGVKPVSEKRKANNLLLDPWSQTGQKSMVNASTPQFLRIFHTTAVYLKESGTDSQIPTLFESVGKTLSEDLVKTTQAVYQFNVIGKEESVWHLDLKNGSGACGRGEPKTAPDATLTMEGHHLTDMFAGKLKPATAYVMGKVKIGGDLQKARKLEKIVKSLKK